MYNFHILFLLLVSIYFQKNKEQINLDFNIDGKQEFITKGTLYFLNEKDSVYLEIPILNNKAYYDKTYLPLNQPLKLIFKFQSKEYFFEIDTHYFHMKGTKYCHLSILTHSLFLEYYRFFSEEELDEMKQVNICHIETLRNVTPVYY